MYASKDSIRQWLDQGKQQGATHVIIACDNKQNMRDLPVYVMPGQDVKQAVATSSDTYVVIEIYDLRLDIDTQLAEFQPWHL